METIVDPFQGPDPADTLLVLLPPAQAQLADFHAHGFVAAVRERALPVDLLLAQLTYQQVMAHTATASLHQQVVRPALERGYRQIWLAGISLGAFNALHYAATHAEHLAGITLVAPYPGTGDVLAEINAAGGPLPWAQTSAGATDDERNWWRWLCRHSAAGQWPTPVYLGTGEADRFLRGQRMLADLLPATQVNYVPGGHDWPTWRTLWQDWLDHGPLARLAGAERGAN